MTPKFTFNPFAFLIGATALIALIAGHAPAWAYFLFVAATCRVKMK